MNYGDVFCVVGRAFDQQVCMNRWWGLPTVQCGRRRPPLVVLVPADVITACADAPLAALAPLVLEACRCLMPAAHICVCTGATLTFMLSVCSPPISGAWPGIPWSLFLCDFCSSLARLISLSGTRSWCPSATLAPTRPLLTPECIPRRMPRRGRQRLYPGADPVPPSSPILHRAMMTASGTPFVHAPPHNALAAACMLGLFGEAALLGGYALQPEGCAPVLTAFGPVGQPSLVLHALHMMAPDAVGVFPGWGISCADAELLLAPSHPSGPA